jgi:RNA polymerase sigma factor (sigma-70 family)
MAMARNQAEAEDLVQDTYLRALPTSDRLGPDSNLKVWLFTILRNVWLNRLRKSRNTSAIVDIYQSTRATREFTDEILCPLIRCLANQDFMSWWVSGASRAVDLARRRI